MNVCKVYYALSNALLSHVDSFSCICIQIHDPSDTIIDGGSLPLMHRQIESPQRTIKYRAVNSSGILLRSIYKIVHNL